RETLAWLRYLLRQRLRAPLLIVGTVRSEELPPAHPLHPLLADLRRAGQLTEVPLGPLSAEEATTLATQVAGHPLDAEQATRLYAETEGNALFVVELVQAGFLEQLADRRTVEEHAGDWEGHPASAAPGALPLATRASSYPQRMQAALSWRLRQLS